MVDLEIEWTKWGRRADFVASKPLPPRKIAKLAAAFDDAEQAASRVWHDDKGSYWMSPDSVPFERWVAISARLHRARLDYISAINARDLFAKCKLENGRAPKSSDAFKYRDAMSAALDRLDVIEKAGPEFSTERERIDARAAAALAEDLYDIAKSKFEDAERGARITGQPRRSSRPRARAVVDGYVSTGKFKIIDGNRVPVLEKIG